MGKMRTAVYCILEAYKRGKLKDGDCIQFYAEVSVDAKSGRRRDFLKDFETVCELEGISPSFDFSFHTYQSQTIPRCTMAIFDEIDAVGETLIQSLLKGTMDLMVALTATISENSQPGVVTKHELLMGLAPVSFSYGYNEALRDGLTNQVFVYKVMNTLEDRLKEVNVTKKWVDTELKYWEFWTNKADEIKVEDPERTKRIRMFQMPRFLYTLPSKVRLVKKIIESTKGRTIIFGSTLEFLEKITPYVIKDDNTYLDDFREGRINIVASAKKIRRGENLPGVVNIIVVGIGKNSDIIEQLIGRSRINEGGKTNLLFLVTSGTYEERWFNEIFVKKSKGRIKERLKFTLAKTLSWRDFDKKK